jgi:hypothetical protein
MFKEKMKWHIKMFKENKILYIFIIIAILFTNSILNLNLSIRHLLVLLVLLIIALNHLKSTQKKINDEISAHLPMYYGLFFSMIGVVGSIIYFIGDKDNPNNHFIFIFHIGISMSISAYALHITRNNLEAIDKNILNLPTPSKGSNQDQKEWENVNKQFKELRKTIQDIGEFNESLKDIKEIYRTIGDAATKIDYQKLAEINQNIANTLQLLNNTNQIKNNIQIMVSQMEQAIEKSINKFIKMTSDEFLDKLNTTLSEQSKTLRDDIKNYYKELNNEISTNMSKTRDNIIELYKNALEEIQKDFIETHNQHIQDIKKMNKNLEEVVKRLDDYLKELENKRSYTLLENLNKNIVDLNTQQKEQIQIMKESSIIYWIIYFFRKIFKRK